MAYTVNGVKRSVFAGDLPNWLIDQYLDRVFRLTQQEESLLRSFVTPYPFSPGAKTMWIPIGYPVGSSYGKADTVANGLVTGIANASGTGLEENRARYGETKLQYLETRKRRITTNNYRFATGIERKDASIRLGNVADWITTEAIAEFNRNKDDIIISSLTADVYEGYEATDGTGWTETTVSFPTSQTIDTDGEEGLTDDKLEDVIELFRNNEINLEFERPVLVVGPRQKKNLRAEEHYINDLYTAIRPKAGPGLPPYMGFNIVVSTRLSATNNIRDCFAFLPSAVIMANEEELYQSVAVRHDRNDMIQILMEHASGAVRVTDTKIVKIRCSEL